MLSPLISSPSTHLLSTMTLPCNQKSSKVDICVLQKKGEHQFCSGWVVSTHLKNISQIGNLPQVGVKIKNVWNHHLVLATTSKKSTSALVVEYMLYCFCRNQARLGNTSPVGTRPSNFSCTSPGSQRKKIERCGCLGFSCRCWFRNPQKHRGCIEHHVLKTVQTTEYKLYQTSFAGFQLRHSR